MAGTPGLSKEDQIERVQVAIVTANRLLEGLTALEELVVTRDFEARQAEKAAAKAATDAEFAEIVSAEDDEDEDEF
jgi:hypothetical protein